MTRRSLTAFAVTIALGAGGALLIGPAAVTAQCLDQTACGEIKAEIVKLKPNLKTARQQLKKARRVLRKMEPGSQNWVDQRTRLKRARRGFRSLKLELKALQRDYRHQSCSSC